MDHFGIVTPAAWMAVQVPSLTNNGVAKKKQLIFGASDFLLVTEASQHPIAF